MAETKKPVPVKTGTSNNSTAEKAPESAADKFRRLANKRVPKAIKVLNNIRGLGNSRQYESTEEQRVKIINALRDALKSVETALTGTKETKTEWTL